METNYQNMNEVGQMEMWSEQKEVSVASLEALAKQIADQRLVCDQAQMVRKEADKKLDELEFKMIETLNALGKDAYLSEVGRFGISHRTSIRLPVGEDREKFFNYLKETGQFDKLIGINSNTLNAWYKTEFERAKEEGRVDSFSIPGLGEPSLTEILSLRKN